MTAPARWYDSSTPLIPWAHQPAMLAEYCAEHCANHLPSRSLASLGLLPRHAQQLLSPAQWLGLLARAERGLAAPDTAFEIGRHLLPGHCGPASEALALAPSLGDALEWLATHPAQLSPLLTPRLVLSPEHALLVWTDAIGLGAMRAFVVDMAMAAVVGLARWLGANERLPWMFCFNRLAPRQLEQHEAYLGAGLRFGCHVDAMILPRELLARPWPRTPGQHALWQAARQTADHGVEQAQQPTHSLLAVLHKLLLDRLHEPPALETCAAALNLSAATLKRRLHAEGTHFQAELDLVRSHLAQYHYRYRGADNAAVARALGFADVPNYRRSFKRWIGLTPQDWRSDMLATS